MVWQLELGSILSIRKFGMVHQSLPVEKAYHVSSICNIKLILYAIHLMWVLMLHVAETPSIAFSSIFKFKVRIKDDSFLCPTTWLITLNSSTRASRCFFGFLPDDRMHTVILWHQQFSHYWTFLVRWSFYKYNFLWGMRAKS